MPVIENLKGFSRTWLLALSFDMKEDEQQQHGILQAPSWFRRESRREDDRRCGSFLALCIYICSFAQISSVCIHWWIWKEQDCEKVIPRLGCSTGIYTNALSLTPRLKFPVNTTSLSPNLSQDNVGLQSHCSPLCCLKDSSGSSAEWIELVCSVWLAALVQRKFPFTVAQH